MVRDNNIIRVSAETNMAKLADTIFKSIIDKEVIVIRGFGEYAVYQMTKALARCKSRAEFKGIGMYWSTDWEEITGDRDGKKLSGLTTRVTYFSMEDFGNARTESNTVLSQ